MVRNVVSDEEDDFEVGDAEQEPVEGDVLEEPEEVDDDEEDEEGQDEYEKDGFIVDDVEPEEEEEKADSDEERRKKKKRRKKKEAEDLDEDDYELLRESNIKIQPGSKKFKRLKKAQQGSDDERYGPSDEEFDGTGRGGKTGDDEGQPLEDLAEEEEQMEEEQDGYIGEEDEMADFIVDEEVDEHGAPVRRTKLQRRKSRQAPGVSPSALQDAHDIFGDVDELLIRRKQGLDSREQREEKRLEDEFEPIIICEKYMTEKDNQIRLTDVPERMQITEESTGTPPVDEFSIKDESSWIHSRLKTTWVVPSPKEEEPVPENQGPSSEKDGPLAEDRSLSEEEGPLSKKEGKVINENDIIKFLELSHVQKLDVPFIATYRKEMCPSLLDDPEEMIADDDNKDMPVSEPKVKWHKVFWAVQDLDRKWLLLQKRKSALHSYYNKRFEEESRRIDDETRLSLNQELFEYILKALLASESEKEVDDVDAKFNLHFLSGETGVDDGLLYKRPKRRSRYSICSKAGLWEVARKFGWSAERLGLHFSLRKMIVEESEDPKETPEEMASNFTCAMFETPQTVLQGARHMAAVDISCDPFIKKHVRTSYMENAVVSTRPTSHGNKAIDSFHQFAGVKWLREKPVTKFEGGQWLLIQKAEEENLIEVSFKLPEIHLNKLINDYSDLYLSNGVSKYAQLWNEQRKLIMQDSFSGFLLPSMEKEARAVLTGKAKNWLLLEYGSSLWSRVSVASYQRKDNDIDSDEDSSPRVMACCWGPGKPATTFVMLDSYGEVLDVLYTSSLTLRSQDVNDQQRKKTDQERLLKFMTDHRPHVVVLGAVNVSCTKLKDDIFEIIFKMVEENPRDVGHEMDQLNILYGDESLPRLYENSRISSDQLSGHFGIVKRAVALGRYLQNPLAMVATLCGSGKEILSWKLTPLENFLTPDEKYGMIEQVMVDVTNQVGLDINLATSHEWMFAPLQFISGLGPRKAASLQRSLVRAGAIFTRKDFLSVHGIGRKVFVNAVGFLRVRRSGLAASSSQFIDLLDDTRIHPESYTLAQELAKFAFDFDKDAVGNDANDDDEALEMAIEHVRDRPDLVTAFNFDYYLEKKSRENKRETLYDIRQELMNGFEDWRTPYKEPVQDEEFYMISGETDDTLSEGRIVQATVRKVFSGRAICALESGLTGILMKEDFSDDWRDIIELSDTLSLGAVLSCKIKLIEKNRYRVFLACKESEMRSNHSQLEQNMDPYYFEGQNNSHSEQQKARKEKELSKKHFKHRMIVHPRFQNITRDEAMGYLSDKDPGESIFVPSSRGPSYLTLTIKISDGVYAHKEIIEGGKEHRDITSMLSIGKTLKIGEDTFEDLDELMDRYVDPLVVYLKAMLGYRKFRKGTEAEVDDLLKIEKAEYPMRIVYCFGISHKHPGTFVLTHIRSSNPHHEFIGLYPKGFKFRRRMFEDIDRLVAYFQRHVDDALHESAPSIRSVAAMVPIRSPATGGSSAASAGSGFDGSRNDSGWRSQSFGRDQSATPAWSGRTNYRNNNGQSGHPSGAPKPYGGIGRGGGSGVGRDSYNGIKQRQDSPYRASKWDAAVKASGDDGNWGWG